MVKDFEVTKWEFPVYFKNDYQETRLVSKFISRAEARRCQEMIESAGYKSWYRMECSLLRIEPTE